jgi:hypothetical protein
MMSFHDPLTKMKKVKKVKKMKTVKKMKNMKEMKEMKKMKKMEMVEDDSLGEVSMDTKAMPHAAAFRWAPDF